MHALFGSKEQLQLATINAAGDSFITEVVGPALGSTDPGRERLLALCEGYLSYVGRRVFLGGCFFVAASAEVGAPADRVHDEVTHIQQQWRDLLAREAPFPVFLTRREQGRSVLLPVQPTRLARQSPRPYSASYLNDLTAADQMLATLPLHLHSA